MKKLFCHGKIFTADRRQLFVQAMLIDDGIITWIGSDEEAGRIKANDSLQDDLMQIDLQGRTVIPGFVDAHLHPMMLAECSKQIACLPPKINSIEELIQTIADVRDELQHSEGDGTLPWICGWGYDEGKYTEKRMPNRYDLDRGAQDVPVFLTRSCEHVRSVNSKALEIAGITRDTQDPPGGIIDRDDHGEPTGILWDSARDLMIPYMPKESEESILSALLDLSKLLSSQGIVAVGDMGNLHPGGNYEQFKLAEKHGFSQRVALYYMWDYFYDDPDFKITPGQRDPSARIRIAGLKLIGDGSISGRTAWLNEPYAGTEENGLSVYSDELLESAVRFVREQGCQLAVHAMGGRAIDRIIDRIERETKWVSGSKPALRVEHVTEPSERAIAKAAKNDFAFVSQPIFEYCEIESYQKNLGSERVPKLYPFRTMLQHGVKLAFSSDAPATSWAQPSDPFVNLKSAVTRRAYDGTDIGQSERLDIETAIILYTKEAAEVCGFEDLGRLIPGYSADFIILNEDIFLIDPDRIDEVSPEETWICGEPVFRA